MTNNPASVVDEATFSVRRVITIAAPIEAVWAAVTEAEHISKWFGEAALAGSGVGTLGTLSWDDYGTIPIRIEAMDAPTLVSYRWGNDDASGILADQIDDAHSTVFTFTLEPIETGT
ncbi:MAG TPA: SRPBCC domain-containing protein, partial [Rhodoglobus sp.]|nr:SRPBCC domain-containing protein [Rhodoglobus sp.]